MDIRKWLAETELPIPSERPIVESILLPGQPDSVPDARRRRKRSLTDSSLLKAPSPPPRGKGLPVIEPDHHGVRDVAGRACSNVSHFTRSELASNSTTSQRYTRKSRHKTRPDRYEAQTKKGKGQDHDPFPSRKSESRKSKRKSGRRKVEKMRRGIKQEFCTENISKNRLTLKPLGKMGLFSKGKASTAAKGRGLPDLVFSEMRYLRNDHVENEHSGQAPDTKKKRKKDHAQSKEEDISAFFTSVRPALADVTGNQLASGGHPTMNTSATKTDRRERAREQSTVLDTAVRTIHSEDVASSLESARRGPYRGSTSYISWSEFSCAPSTVPDHRKRISDVHGERIGSSFQERKERPHRHASLLQQGISSVVRKPIAADMEKASGSSVAPVQSGFFRLRSLPQRCSSPGRSLYVDQVLNRRSTEDEPPPSLMSAVARSPGNIDSQERGSRSVRSVAISCASETAVLAQKQTSKDAAGTLVYRHCPQESSSLGGVLQCCNDTSQAERPRTALRRSLNNDMRFSPDLRDTVGQSRDRAYPRNTQVPKIQFPAPDTQPAQLANFSGPSFHAQQEQRQHLPLPVDLEEEHYLQHPDTVARGHKGETRFSIQEDAEGFPEEPVSYGMMEAFDDDDDDDEDDTAGLDYAADDVEPVRGLGYTNVVASGFWRPNKLY